MMTIPFGFAVGRNDPTRREPLRRLRAAPPLFGEAEIERAPKPPLKGEVAGEA